MLQYAEKLISQKNPEKFRHLSIISNDSFGRFKSDENLVEHLEHIDTNSSAHNLISIKDELEHKCSEP